MNETTYTPVTDGFHDCKIVFSQLADKHYDHEYYQHTKELREIKVHKVFKMKLVPIDTDIENPCAYDAEFPAVLIAGFKWSFKDKDGKSVWRKATIKDTEESVEYAKRCFKDWSNYLLELEEGNNELAFGWFVDREKTKDVIVRAKLTFKGYQTGKDGLEYPKCYAAIYPPFEKKPIISETEAAQFTRGLKAANIKLFGKPKSASVTATTSKPTMPPPPAKPSVDKLREEAFAVYQSVFTDDKTGACFYPKCAEIIGRDVNTWESWTADDWTKIKQTFECPF